MSRCTSNRYNKSTRFDIYVWFTSYIHHTKSNDGFSGTLKLQSNQISSSSKVAVDSWRKDRDLYFADGLQGWKDQIKEWKVSMKEVYNISMFIPFEHLVDATKGPELLKRLTKLLEDFGFPIVVADDDMPCVWYKALGKEILEQIDSHGYEYSDYMPGYTQEHKDLLMKELSSMVEEYKDDDKELLLILQEYMDQVQSDISLDQPYKDV